MTEKSFYKQPTLPDFSSGEQAPPLPQKIGPYKIETLLNKGGMSLLYLGIHPEFNQPLAIKVLSPEYVTHPEAVERFLKEAQIIGMTKHPNIVKLYGQGEWENGLYIAMEFIRGISLSQFIMQQALSLKRCVDIILQVGYALLHLHTHGVIHRDLKPENILITEDGETKVIDFGIAQLHEEPAIRSEPKRFMGTPSYMSPEQKEDPSKVTYSSDIYSLGVIAFELVIGKLSYGVINLSLLPKGLKRIIEKALAVSQQERYQDIVDFITDLSQYLKSGEIEKDRPGSDQIKELIETLQKGAIAISPLNAPDWPQLEIGLAKHKGPGQMAAYYDFFKFPNNMYGIILAEPISSSIEAIVYIAGLRGMVRSLIHEKSPSPKETFKLVEFISLLNQLLIEDTIKENFALGFVLLNPLNDQLAFVSCGLGRLIHLPQGSTIPRLLASENPLLGSEVPAEFAHCTDNWNIGDTLILHSLETLFPAEEEARKQLEVQLLLTTTENALLSAGHQADSILKKMVSLPSISSVRVPKMLISIRRIS
jgi:eukaryotic-like serine/threonine-protein kinase